MSECLFCKIAAGEIPASIVYEDENVVVIPDIQPKAKIHLLLIPKAHFVHITDAMQNAPQLVADCLKVITHHAADWGLAGGFRLIVNQGADGGQTVAHLHMHLLGGETLDERI